MDPGPYPEISYNEHENFIRPSRRGPVGGYYVEDKFERISSQKYQYYEGHCNVIGVPYRENGKRNSNYTSLNFVSNAVFYEPSKNLGLDKNDMYTTTNKLHQSKSVDRLPNELPFEYSKYSKSPPRPVRSNNNHIANMTTIDTDLTKNINKIYKDKISHVPAKEMSFSRLVIKGNNENNKQQNQYEESEKSEHNQSKPKIISKINGNSRNKTLDRCVTAPTLTTQRDFECKENEDDNRQETNKKPPRMPCKQRSNCCEILNEVEYPLVNKKKLSRASSQDCFERDEKESVKSEIPKQKQDKYKLDNSIHEKNKCSSRNSKTNSVKGSKTGINFYDRHYLSPKDQCQINKSRGCNPITGEDDRSEIPKERPASQNQLRNYMQRDKLDNNDSIMSNKESAKQSSSVMECDCGGGYTSMWLNHLNREEKVHDNRRKKIEYNQRQIFMNPELFGNNYNDKNSIKKNYLINKSVHGGYGNSLINDMTGCPIQKVHKLKEKKREKLKKYLYQGKQNNCYEYNKYKLQSGDKVSIELTPDYHFKRVLDPERQSYNNIIIDQIKQNSVKKQSEHDWNVQEEQKNQRCYERKMAKLQKKQEKHKEAAKQTFFHDIEFQLKQKQKYDRNLR